MEVDPHRVERDLEIVGDLLVLEPLDLPQDEDTAHRLVESAQRGQQVLSEVAGFRLRFGAGSIASGPVGDMSFGVLHQVLGSGAPFA